MGWGGIGGGGGKLGRGEPGDEGIPLDFLGGGMLGIGRSENFSSEILVLGTGCVVMENG